MSPKQRNAGNSGNEISQLSDPQRWREKTLLRTRSL